MFAEIRDFHHVRIQPRLRSRLFERRFVHTRGAGADYDSRQFVLFDRVLNELLTVFRTHIRIIRGVHHAVLRTNGFHHFLHVYRRRDIRTAMTDKYTYSLHFSLPV